MVRNLKLEDTMTKLRAYLHNLHANVLCWINWQNHIIFHIIDKIPVFIHNSNTTWVEKIKKQFHHLHKTRTSTSLGFETTSPSVHLTEPTKRFRIIIKLTAQVSWPESRHFLFSTFKQHIYYIGNIEIESN